MMPAMASRVSCAATSMLRLRLKVMVTIDSDSVDVERMLSMPSTVATESSTQRVTALSISSGEAPGRTVRTETMGMSTSGKRSTPSLEYETPPTTTSARMSMTAKTGRATQTSASFCI